jgi:hypothetical protein
VSGEPTFTSATIDLDFSGGIRFSPYVAAGVEGAFRYGLRDQIHQFNYSGAMGSNDVQVSLFEASAFASWFPYASGFHLDAYAGLCLLRPGVATEIGLSTLPGVIAGTGIGWLGRGESIDVGFGARAYVASASPSTNYGGTLLIELASHVGPPPGAPIE